MDKILITTSTFGKADTSVLDTLAQRSLEPVLNPYERKLTEAEVGDLFTEFDPIGMVAGVEPLTEAALGKAANLKVISRCGIGMDNVDIAAAEKLGISVFNTPEAPSAAVAELTLALILSALRSIPAIDAAVRSGDWYRPTGRLLGSLTVGIIGCGRIGSLVAEMAGAFGSKIIGCDPFLDAHPAIDLSDIDTVFREADVVTLHIPYSKEVHHLVDARRLALMKSDSILINASRGGLVDETALSTGLENGRPAAAALDCYESEPYSGPLTERRNAVLSSHIGSYAKEARARMESEAIRNLLFGLGVSGS